MDEQQVFDKLEEYVQDSFPYGTSYNPYPSGSLWRYELSELEEHISKLGLVEYYFNYSGHQVIPGPPYEYTFTKKGMEFYNKFKGGGK